jgi:hypothetical protein
MVGSDRAMCGSEWIDERLVDEGLPCTPTLGVIGIAGRVARRASCMSLRPAFILPGEKRAAMALSVLCVARRVSIGAPMLPSELWRESVGAPGRGMATIEHAMRLLVVSLRHCTITDDMTYRNSKAPAAEPRSSMSITQQMRRLQSLINLPSRARLRVWYSKPNPACTSTSLRLRQKEKLSLRSSRSCTICTRCLHASPTATSADEPLSPRSATTTGR